MAGTKTKSAAKGSKKSKKLASKKKPSKTVTLRAMR